MKITVVTESIAVDSTARLTGTITQEDGVTGFKPDTAYLTVLDRTTGTVIRVKENINAYVNAGGGLSVELTPANNAIVTAGRTREVHSALLEWEWSGGTREGKHRIDFTVEVL
jgi:hypothetical protein